MGNGGAQELDRRVAVAHSLRGRTRRMRYLVALLVVMGGAVPASAQECRFLCEPTLLVEPTMTWEKDATVFETIFALDLSTPIPRVGVTLEAITKPFSDENEVELESELKLYWLEGERTGGWLSSHFDIVDKFSPAKRPTDKRAYTHKLNLELDTAIAVFSRLPESNWLHDVEIEGSLDYVATGLPKGASRWSFSLVFVCHSSRDDAPHLRSLRGGQMRCPRDSGRARGLATSWLSLYSCISVARISRSPVLPCRGPPASARSCHSSSRRFRFGSARRRGGIVGRRRRHNDRDSCRD